MMDLRPTVRTALKQKLWHLAVDEVHAARHAQDPVGSKGEYDRALTGAQKSQRMLATKKPLELSIRAFYRLHDLSRRIDPARSLGHAEILAEDRCWRVLLVDLVGAPLLLRDELRERHYLIGRVAFA
jgi:hypothetical protein